MIDTLSHASFIRLVVTLGAIWWAGQKAIHEEVYQSPSATHQFICRFIFELEVLPTKAGKELVGPSVAVVRPKAPPPGFSKIHVDAGIPRAHTRGSAAAVCRDAQNVVLLVINRS